MKDANHKNVVSDIYSKYATDTFGSLIILFPRMYISWTPKKLDDIRKFLLKVTDTQDYNYVSIKFSSAYIKFSF